MRISTGQVLTLVELAVLLGTVPGGLAVALPQTSETEDPPTSTTSLFSWSWTGSELPTDIVRVPTIPPWTWTSPTETSSTLPTETPSTTEEFKTRHRETVARRPTSLGAGFIPPPDNVFTSDTSDTFETESTASSATTPGEVIISTFETATATATPTRARRPPGRDITTPDGGQQKAEVAHAARLPEDTTPELQPQAEKLIGNAILQRLRMGGLDSNVMQKLISDMHESADILSGKGFPVPADLVQEITETLQGISRDEIHVQNIFRLVRKILEWLLTGRVWSADATEDGVGGIVHIQQFLEAEGFEPDVVERVVLDIQEFAVDLSAISMSGMAEVKWAELAGRIAHGIQHAINWFRHVVEAILTGRMSLKRDAIYSVEGVKGLLPRASTKSSADPELLGATESKNVQDLFDYLGLLNQVDGSDANQVVGPPALDLVYASIAKHLRAESVAEEVIERLLGTGDSASRIDHLVQDVPHAVLANVLEAVVEEQMDRDFPDEEGQSVEAPTGHLRARGEDEEGTGDVSDASHDRVVDDYRGFLDGLRSLGHSQKAIDTFTAIARRRDKQKYPPLRSLPFSVRRAPFGPQQLIEACRAMGVREWLIKMYIRTLWVGGERGLHRRGDEPAAAGAGADADADVSQGLFPPPPHRIIGGFTYEYFRGYVLAHIGEAQKLQLRRLGAEYRGRPKVAEYASRAKDIIGRATLQDMVLAPGEEKPPSGRDYWPLLYFIHIREYIERLVEELIAPAV